GGGGGGDGGGGGGRAGGVQETVGGPEEGRGVGGGHIDGAARHDRSRPAGQRGLEMPALEEHPDQGQPVGKVQVDDRARGGAALARAEQRQVARQRPRQRPAPCP